MGSGGGGGEMRRVVEDMVVLPGFIKNYKANGFSNICRHELLGFLLVHNRCWILGFLVFINTLALLAIYPCLFSSTHVL